MRDLKPISADAIARSLARAERYRLLNEPLEAESICRDVLRAEPGNHQALVTLLLALTDQFGRVRSVGLNEARAVLRDLPTEYERAYYAGVISERWAKALLRDRALGHIVHDWVREAMSFYEIAEPLSPPGNEDAVLRWNACVRLLERETGVTPRIDEEPGLDIGDSGPQR